MDKDGFFKATNYDVAAITSYKGQSPKRLVIYNPNDSSRFDMDVGNAYLLFVYRQRGQYILDDCGWSDEIENSDFALAQLKKRSDFANQPSHCWKGFAHFCVPDLRRK